MNRPNALRLKSFAALTTLVIAGLAAGCGGDDDSASETPAQPANQTEKTDTGPTGPASADDERPAAPDDKISDRPGGPNEKGERSGSGGKGTAADGSDDVSAAEQPKPVEP